MVSEIANKPKSRFVEHFDAMPPAELLDIIADGMEHEAPLKINTKQSISLFTRPSNNIIGMKSAEILPTSSIDQAAVTPVVSRSASTSAKSNKQSKIKPKPTRSTSAHRLTNRSKSDPVIAIVNDTIESKLEQIISDDASSSSKENQDEQYTKPSNIKSVFNTHSLNRADVIIKRYDSWNEFIQRIYFWFSEMIRHSQIAERSYNHLLKDKLGHKSKNTTITSLQSVFARATTEFSNEELKFKETLQGFLTVLEKMKKETTTQMKGLKSRTDLDREEFLKRAEVTVSFMSQLDKACKEARRTIDKGGQVTTDPWLCNLYVLRQLKKEVDEENRLRCLMVPIQQHLAEFEKRLLATVKQALQSCLEKPGALPSEQIDAIRECLGQLDDTSEWKSFIEANPKHIVNEQSPTRDYLHLNYNNKSNPLVLTLYKGELERRTGVLGKHVTKYYTLTQSGFLHQFKMNEKVSPEFSIYVPKTIIIPSTDISHLALGDLKDVPVPKEGFSFEIQRPGSVLQRDKSYVFRTFNIESFVAWTSLLSDVASQNPHPKALQYSTSTLQTILSATSQIEVQSQQATPPPSPMKTYNPQLAVNLNNSSPRSSVYNEANMDSPISSKDV